jgi:hypothetical protein
MMRGLTSVIILLPLLVGGGGRCPEPNYPDLKDCPFPVDPNLVRGKLLGWIRVEVGQELIHTWTWCDPDGDPATAEILAGPEGVQLVDRSKTSSYTLLWRPRVPGVAAIVVRVTDKPIDAEPRSSIGTVLVQAVPRGQRLGLSRGPRGCGGQP